MRVLYLPSVWTILLDSAVWALIHLGMAYLTLRFPEQWLLPTRWLFRARAWERGGTVYQRWFRVKRWKAHLPDGGVLSGGFSKRQISSRDPQYLRQWVIESCRAEACHWLTILPAPLFFLWNLPWVGVFMLGYALAANMPCLIAQRYNRPRLMAILAECQVLDDRGRIGTINDPSRQPVEPHTLR